MVKKNWLYLLSCIGAIFVIGMGFLLKLDLDRKGWERIEAVFPDRGLPRINITLNGVTLEEINDGSKETKYEGNDLVIYDGRNDVSEFTGVRVKGRGNGTWVQEKKPYQIKFDRKVDLFGMGKAKKWVLLANALDASNLRNEMAVYLGKMLDMNGGIDGRFIELYIDEEYLGLYYLTSTIDNNKQSIDLRDPMGVLVELDNVYGWMEDYYKTSDGDKLVMHDVVVDDLAEKAMDEFVKQYNQFEVAVLQKDYKTINELIDVQSFAQYYLLNEFSVNPDAYWTSFYMYKDGYEDKIHAGPGWDFDLAFANRAWGNWMGEDFYSPTRLMARRDEIMSKEQYEEMGLTIASGTDWYGVSRNLSRTFFNLMEIPAFRDEVNKMYIERMKGKKEELMRQFDLVVDTIQEAALINETKWGVSGFQREVDHLRKWISERYDYFDEVFSVNN